MSDDFIQIQGQVLDSKSRLKIFRCKILKGYTVSTESCHALVLWQKVKAKILSYILGFLQS